MQSNKAINFFFFLLRAVKFSTQLMGKALAKRIKCTILYATETGKSEGFAKTLSSVFKYAFDVKVRNWILKRHLLFF